MDISDFIGAAKTFHVLGIKVTKDGDLINEWYSEPECRRNIYSATKSFTSCAVGFAVQEGLLSLDEKLTDAFPEDLPDVIDDNLKMATVRDLLTMCLGQERGSFGGAWGNEIPAGTRSGGRYSYGDGTRSTTTERGSQESPGPGQPENRSGDDPDDSVSP